MLRAIDVLRAVACALALVTGLTCGSATGVPPPGAMAAEKAPAAPLKTPPTKPPTPAQPAPAQPPDVKPYDAQLLRLAELLGALSVLRGLCGDPDAATWQKRMQALLDAEGTTPARKDRLAGAYNHGMAGYELSYRSCTLNAQAIIDRFLAESAAIARDVENRFGAT